jgi:signal transduction histidine kinase
MEKGRYHRTPIPDDYIYATAEDVAGNMWFVSPIHGRLIRLSPNEELQTIPPSAFAGKGFPLYIAAAPKQQGIWAAFDGGEVAYLEDGKARVWYSKADGLAPGRVTDARFDADGSVWLSSEGGLSRIKNGRVATWTRKNGLPCEGVHWSVEDGGGWVWLNTPCGLVRVKGSDLENVVNGRSGALPSMLFDSSDGVDLFGDIGSTTPQVGQTPDGKIWFRATDGISMVDPRHLALNKLRPAVHVEQVTADRKIYDADLKNLKLPALVRDVKIDYTALSFAAPEKVRFRYKLEGKDQDWVDAGNRRQAFYNDLPPRKYRFRVIAANNSGVWNEEGAFLDFSVAPAYYQTGWFLTFVAGTGLVLLAAVFQLRARQVARRFQLRMEERVNERIRIARDLHDTLLQSFQGVLLKFYAVSFKLPDDSAIRTEMDGVIDQARVAISEGRDAVQGLRSSTLVSNDLARAIDGIGVQLAAEKDGADRPEFRVQVEGVSRELAPLVRDEIYRIAVEALRNAFRHAEAKRIEVEIRYDARQLRVRIRDDGKGMDQKVLESGREGHHGLPGMHERAKLAGGKLAIWSEVGSGSEVELSVPGGIAYLKTGARNEVEA